MLNSNKKQLGILLATMLLVVAAMANVYRTSAQTAVGTLDPLKLSGTFIVPRDPNNTIGSSTVNGYFNGITVSSCTGCGAGSSPVIFRANGGTFVTTSTINFQQGSNITITTSTDGTYIITGAAGGGGGSVSTSSAITINNYPFWTSVGGGLSGTSTLTTSAGTLIQTGNFTITGVTSSSELRSPSSTIIALTLTKIPNLTSNGFVKTGSGNGTLSVDTNTYLTSAVTSLTALSPLTVSATSGAIIIQAATSSASTNGILTSSDWSTFNGKGNVNVAAAGTLSGNFPLWVTSASSTLSATSTLSQSAGLIYQASVPVFSGGTLITPAIVQNASGSVIIQNTTGTTSVGNFSQGGGVNPPITTTTTLNKEVFCSGGFFPVIVTSSITITIPSRATIATATCASNAFWSGSFQEQFVRNSSTQAGAMVYQAVSDSGQFLSYSPGTPTALAPGQTWRITTQLANTSTVQGINATGTTMNIMVSLYSTSSPFSIDYINNRMGVNTTQPSSTVHIKGLSAQTTDLFRVASSSNSTSSLFSISPTGTTMFDDLITGTSTSQFGEPLGPHCFIIYGTDASNAATSTPTYTWMKNHAWATSTSACFSS